MNQEYDLSNDMIPRILIASDNRQELAHLADLLQPNGYGVYSFLTVQQALTRLETTDYQLVIIDLDSNKRGASKLMDKIRKTHPETGVLGITGHPSLDEASEFTE